jgi:hypothetical protein
MNLKNVLNCSTCSTSLTSWVIELVRDQYLLLSRKMDKYNLVCQSNGGQKGKEVRLFSLLDESGKTKSKNGGICQFWADLTYTGKTFGKVAAEMNHPLKQFNNFK